MPKCLIGLSVQNFSETIFDTEDLSTIRGASIGAIDFVRDLAIKDLCAVSTGGSNGLWTYDGSDPEGQLSALKAAAQEHQVARHLCVATAFVPCSANFLADKVALSAKLARAQMRSANVAYPATAGALGKVCPVDLVSPVGTDAIWYGGKQQHVSPSVSARRKYGVAAKQSFVKRLACGDGTHKIFSNPSHTASVSLAMLLSSISEGAEAPNGLKQNLHDKIAVIHLDGNGAGNAQLAAIEAAQGYDEQIEAQQAFDNRLAKLRQILADTVLTLLNDKGGVGAPGAEEVQVRNNIGKPAEKVIRFEALLWAGDEITFIVPARLGWAVTQALVGVFEGEAKLTAAIGLVYCHHDAPIARIRALAESLCDHVKEVDRTRTLVFPMVLESFDHIGRGLDDYLTKRALTGQEKGFFVFSCEDMSELQAQANKWADPNSEMSRRQIRMSAIKAHRNPKSGCLKEARQSMLIEEYWDYLIPCPPAAGEGA